MRVRRILLRRGAPPSTVDDALQTAALRAIQRSDGFDCADGLVNWVTKVAWHEVQAEWHRQARTVHCAMPELLDDRDPARVAMGRRTLERVRQGLCQLNDTDRQAILSALDDSSDSKGPLEARVKMRRRRARQRLASLLENDERVE